jgi:hypothetical protein
MLTIQIDQKRWMLERTHQKDAIISWIELNFEKWRRKSIFSKTIARDHIPNTYGVVGRSAQQIMTRSIPTQ